MLVLLEMNGINLEFTQEELVSLGLGVASGTLNRKDIGDWVNRHISLS